MYINLNAIYSNSLSLQFPYLWVCITPQHRPTKQGIFLITALGCCLSFSRSLRHPNRLHGQGLWCTPNSLPWERWRVNLVFLSRYKITPGKNTFIFCEEIVPKTWLFLFQWISWGMKGRVKCCKIWKSRRDILEKCTCCTVTAQSPSHFDHSSRLPAKHFALHHRLAQIDFGWFLNVL